MTPAEASLKGVDIPPAIKERTTDLESRVIVAVAALGLGSIKCRDLVDDSQSSVRV
jgi:hypothetical protein